MVHGEGTHRRPVLCLAARAKHYLHPDCFSFVSYVMDTREKSKASINDVPIMWEYPNVFMKDLTGVPPESQVEFRIDLDPNAAPIAKAHVG